MSTQSQRRSWWQRLKRLFRSNDAPAPVVTSYLKVTSAEFVSRRKLVIDTTDGIRLAYHCGSAPVRMSLERLLYTDELDRDHEQYIQEMTGEEECPYDTVDIEQLLVPSLRQWAGNRQDLDVLELGPAHTINVPLGLAHAMTSYTAVDFSPPFSRKQQELLSAHPDLLAKSRLVVADTYDLSLPESSCDVIVVCCHPPLVSASNEDKRLVLDKIRTWLKPDGVLALFPWEFEKQPASVSRYLLTQFRPCAVAFDQADDARLLLLCKASQHHLEAKGSYDHECHRPPTE